MSDDEKKLGATGRFIELPARYSDPNYGKKRQKKRRPDPSVRPAPPRPRPAPTCGCVEQRHPETGAVLSTIKYCRQHRPAPLSAAGRPKVTP